MQFLDKGPRCNFQGELAAFTLIFLLLNARLETHAFRTRVEVCEGVTATFDIIGQLQLLL